MGNSAESVVLHVVREELSESLLIVDALLGLGCVGCQAGVVQRLEDHGLVWNQLLVPDDPEFVAILK